MKIVICHMGFSGYTAACWRSLMAFPGVSIKVFTPETHYGYSEELLKGLPHQVFSDSEFQSTEFVRRFADLVAEENPDALVICGWIAKPFTNLLRDPRFSTVRKLMAIDTMWEWSLRNMLSRFRLGGLVRRLDGVIVAGDRGRMFARYIGFRPSQIFTSTYGYDAVAFADCYPNRGNVWPRRFVFVGRYAPIKGLDALIDAYGRYRTRFGEDAWELHCYGQGPLENELGKVPGLVNRGFLQPRDLPAALTEAGAFVLPSLKDPWGVALAEGAGAGLPLVASDAVSSSVDLVRHLYNGYVVPAGDADRLLDALTWIHKHYGELPEMGRSSMVYAGAYTPERWASRLVEACRRK